MIAFAVIIDQILVYGATNVVLAEEDHPIRDFAFEREMEAFEMCIAVRRPRWRADGPDASALEQATKRRMKRTVAIHDEVILSPEETAERIREIASNL